MRSSSIAVINRICLTRRFSIGEHDSMKTLFFLLMLVLVGCLSAGADEKIPTKTLSNGKPAVAAADITRIYEKNSVMADQSLCGHLLCIYGKIDDIGTDVLGRPYLVLEGHEVMEGFACYFTKDDVKVIAKLQKGITVAILGRVARKIINANIENCSVVEVMK